MLCGGSPIDGVSNDALTWLILGGLGASVDHNDFFALDELDLVFQAYSNAVRRLSD